MMKKAFKLKTLEEFKEEHYGKLGTRKRKELKQGFEDAPLDSETTVLNLLRQNIGGTLTI